MTYTAQPSPTPIGTSRQQIVSPQPAPAPTVAWSDTEWNKVFNDYWNKGYNRNFGSSFTGSGMYGDAQTKGYMSGLAKAPQAQINTTTQPGSVPVQSPSVQQGPSEADLQNEMMNQINSMYSQSESILNDQTTNLGQQSELAKQGINLQRDQAERSYKSAYEEAQKLAEGQKNTLELSQRSAESEAIRNLNALQQQASSRYGQGSSTGGAVFEIISQEFLRNQGNIQAAYFNSLDKVNQFTSQAFQVFQNANQKLEEDVALKMQQVDQSFRDGLLQISMAKAQNEQAKSQARINLMQDALTNARNIANFKLESEIGLIVWKEQQRTQAQDAINYAKQLASEAEQNTFAGQSQIEDVRNSSFLNNNTSSGLQAYNYKPRIQNRDDEFRQFSNPWLS